MVRAELKVIGGKQHGKSIPLSTRKFLIGRETDCHLRPSSESVSRHHCVLTVDEYGVQIRDLGSTNGTLVNGERIHGRVILKPRDRITIGKLEFEVGIYMTDPAEKMALAVAEDAQAAAGPGASTLLDSGAGTPSSSQTMVDLPVSHLLEQLSAETAVMASDTTIIPTAAEPAATEWAEPPTPVPPTTAAPAVVAPAPEQPAAQVPAPPPEPIVSPYPYPSGQPAMPQPQYMGQPYMAPQPMVPYQPYPPQPQYPPSPYPQQLYPPNPYAVPYGVMPDQQQLLQQQYYQQQLLQQQLYQQQLYQSQPQSLAPEPVPETPPVSAASAGQQVKLPDPSETGVKPPAAPPPQLEGAQGEKPEAKPAEVKAKDNAADIIRKYLQRR